MFPPDGNAWAQPQMQPAPVENNFEEDDGAHRPPNAFILYSQAMRSEVQQQNPSLSNTEVSRLLGKMWKEVPSESKNQYKQQAARLQEEFKRQHPNYTYRKARRKRALNELLTKSSQGFPGMPGSMMPMFQQMGQQPGQMYTGMPVMQGMPQMGQPMQGVLQQGMQNMPQQMMGMAQGMPQAMQGMGPMYGMPYQK